MGDRSVEWSDKPLVAGRHQDTGKPRGFAFLAYEDQRSTVLAVDNLNGCTVAGRIITVDHVDNYKRKRAEVLLARAANHSQIPVAEGGQMKILS